MAAAAAAAILPRSMAAGTPEAGMAVDIPGLRAVSEQLSELVPSTVVELQRGESAFSKKERRVGCDALARRLSSIVLEGLHRNDVYPFRNIQILCRRALFFSFILSSVRRCTN